METDDDDGGVGPAPIIPPADKPDKKEDKTNKHHQDDESLLCEAYHSDDRSCVDGVFNDSQTTGLANNLLEQSRNASKDMKMAKWVTIGLASAAVLALGISVVATGGGSLALLLAVAGIQGGAAAATFAAASGAFGLAATVSGIVWSDLGTKATDLSNASSALSNNNNGKTQVAVYGGNQLQVVGKGSIQDLDLPKSGVNTILAALFGH